MLLSELLEKVEKIDECQIYNEREFQVFARVTSHVEMKSCVFINEKKYIPFISPTTTMIITKNELKDLFAGREEGVCICDEPRSLFFVLLNYTAKQKKSVFKTVIGRNCSISDQAYIDSVNVIIGNNVRIEEFACIYEGTVIEDNCVIHSGAKVGIQDFNYYIDKGEIQHVVHQGKIILKKGVVVGFNSIIGRALYEYNHTLLEEQCKIGCNSCVGHDSRIGKKTLIGANVVIGGNTSIGESVNISIGASIKNAIVIGNKANIEMGAVVVRDIDKNMTVFGNPAKRVVVPKI